MTNSAKVRHGSSRSTLTTKGQVTIPKPIRDRLGLRPGDSIDFAMDEQGTVRIMRCPKASPLDKWIGFLDEYKGQDPDALVREMRGH
jgi:antitoxin PrlF